MDAIGYARVSSPTQDLNAQILGIKNFASNRDDNLVTIFTDKTSGRNLNRRGFQDMINFIDSIELAKDKKISFENSNMIDIKSILRDSQLLSTNIGMVIVHSMDRLGRNLNDLMKIIEYLKSKNIKLVSVTEDIDLSTPHGMLAFQVLSSYAEYERKIIAERTNNGREIAMMGGQIKFGRPRKDIDLKDVKKEIAMGIPKSVICKKYGIKRTTLYNKLKEDKENVKL